jgi:acetyl-CoA carboxylase biotin carboxyl carrier protein
MKAKEIQELIDFIAKSGLAEVKIETKEFKINIKKENVQPVNIVEQVAAAIPQQVASPVVAAAQITPQAEAPKTEEKKADTSKYVPVPSPMIGTFYRSSNPETPAFVQVGDRIEKGQTVCIIEAMKLFNEIESEISGTIVQVMVENASPVEFDQPLFLVDPS